MASSEKSRKGSRCLRPRTGTCHCARHRNVSAGMDRCRAGVTTRLHTGIAGPAGGRRAAVQGERETLEEGCRGHGEQTKT